jgi:hypothetical protein
VIFNSLGPIASKRGHRLRPRTRSSSNLVSYRRHCLMSGGSIRADSSYDTMRTLVGARECRHARDAQHAKSFRTRFFGFPLAWNVVWSGSRLGSRVFSVLRLHPLLRSVRLHLRSARSFRLPALRAAGKLFSAAWLLHFRRPPRTDHGAVSAGNGPPATTVKFLPPTTSGSRQPVIALT